MFLSSLNDLRLEKEELRPKVFLMWPRGFAAIVKCKIRSVFTDLPLKVEIKSQILVK